jgi:hypothetical protein
LYYETKGKELIYEINRKIIRFDIYKTITIMKNLKWIERKFNFGYGPEYFPLFIERLRSTAPRIEEMTKNISEEKLCFMQDGKWSVKQHIGHLTDLEVLHEARLHDFTDKKEVLRPADMENKVTEQADHNKVTLNQLISDLRRSREKFIKHVSTFSDEQLLTRSFHPRLKEEINVVDLLHFVSEHDLFHQTHIAIILEK